MSQLIQLTRGFVALVDDADLDWLSQRAWRAFVQPTGDVYAMTGGSRSTYYMHRLILNAPKGLQVDHIDGDRLNNTRANLRLANGTENGANRAKTKACKSGFKGVFPTRPPGRRFAKIAYKKAQFYLGTYDTPEEASAVYEAKARELFGEFYREPK